MNSVASHDCLPCWILVDPRVTVVPTSIVYEESSPLATVGSDHFLDDDGKSSGCGMLPIRTVEPNPMELGMEDGQNAGVPCPEEFVLVWTLVGAAEPPLWTVLDSDRVAFACPFG